MHFLAEDAWNWEVGVGAARDWRVRSLVSDWLSFVIGHVNLSMRLSGTAEVVLSDVASIVPVLQRNVTAFMQAAAQQSSRPTWCSVPLSSTTALRTACLPIMVACIE